MFEQPTSRRLGPVLIAFLVLLAAAAGTVGYFGARRVLGIGQDTVSPSTSGTTGSGQTPGTTPADTGDGPGPSATQPSGPKATVAPGDPTKCPEVTALAMKARGLNDQLTLVLYIEARKTGAANAEVWVCKNADDVLIYQGHVLSGLLDKADNGVNTLLLAEGVRGKVEAAGEATWVATNPSGATWTEYHVSYTRLLVVSQPGGVTKEEYEVIKSNP